MNLIDWLLVNFTAALPMFLRVSTFFFALPIFGRGVPSLLKVGLSGFITFLLFPVVRPPAPLQDLAGYTLLCLEEAAIGLAMGLIVAMVVGAVYFAGQLLDVPVGFSMVNVIDPQTGEQTPLLAQFHFVLAILILFIVNGHHTLLLALAHSFALIPVGEVGTIGSSVDVFIKSFGKIFALGLRIALPVIGALFVTDVALGIVARAVPQINVFFVGFPLKIGLGVALLLVVLPVYVVFVAGLFGPSGEMASSLMELMAAFGPD